MTNDEIRAAIAADPALAALAASRENDAAIADALSVGKTQRVATEIGHGTILEVLGTASGNALLDAIYATADFRYVKPLLEQGRLRLDSNVVRGALDAMAAGGVITTAEATTLKAVAERPAPVSSQQVSQALNEV